MNRKEKSDKLYYARRTRYMIRLGIIVKQPCEICGTEAEAHHLTYDETHNIKWLCHQHHLAEHKGPRVPYGPRVPWSKLIIKRRREGMNKEDFILQRLLTRLFINGRW